MANQGSGGEGWKGVPAGGEKDLEDLLDALEEGASPDEAQRDKDMAELEEMLQGLEEGVPISFAAPVRVEQQEREIIRERLPEHRALERFEGLDTDVAERFNEAREAYFAAYAEHMRDGRPRNESARLLRTKAAYRAARKAIADRVLNARMRIGAQEDRSWKDELLTAWEAEELNALHEAGEQALEKKTALAPVPPPAAREVKPSRKTLRAGLMAALAPLLAQSVPMANAPEVPVRAKPIEEPLRPEAVSADNETRIEISIPATKKGANEMLLQALKEVKAKDEGGLVYANLAGGEDVKPKDAMRALSDALGFQKREANGERSAIVHEGDRITLDKNGNLVYVTSKEEEHLLTKDGKPLVQDWLRYDAP